MFFKHKHVFNVITNKMYIVIYLKKNLLLDLNQIKSLRIGIRAFKNYMALFPHSFMRPFSHLIVFQEFIIFSQLLGQR